MAQPEFVTETFDYDGGRQVTVYVPPEPPEAIVFAGDGQMIAPWGVFLEAADGPPTMIVGVHRVADEMLRLHEYSPGFDSERFAAHERFFVEEVGAWARSRFGVTLPAERAAVCGVSAGGELALALGLRHPDRYGAIFAGSPGVGYRPLDAMPSPLPRTYLVAVRWNRFSSTTRRGGRRRCAMPRRMSCCARGSRGMTRRCGEQSSRGWSRGHLERQRRRNERSLGRPPADDLTNACACATIKA